MARSGHVLALLRFLTVERADYNDGDSLIVETILELDDERVEQAAGAGEIGDEQ
jgi:hypothetical protein